MRVANELKVPFFGPLAGSPTLRRPHQPLVFPVRAEHREEFRALLTQAKSLGTTKVAFLRSDSETDQQHLANVKLICDELGMKLVLDMPFKSHVNTKMNLQKPDLDKSSPTAAWKATSQPRHWYSP